MPGAERFHNSDVPPDSPPHAPVLPRRLALVLPWAATGLLGACLVLLWPMRHQGPAALALLLNAVLLPTPLLLRQRAPHRGVEVMPDAPALPAAAPACPPPNEVRNQLLTQLSHAVRTPLNAVMGMTQLALQTRLTAEQRDLLQQADAASQALLGLLHDALDVAALESGQATMARQPLRLEDVVAQALEQVRPAHARPEVALICDWASPDLLRVQGQLLGDAARLQRVLVTLLANALKFTLAGEVRLRVQGELDPERAHVQLTLAVQDSGIGMSAQQLQAAFPVDDAAPPRQPAHRRRTPARFGPHAPPRRPDGGAAPGPERREPRHRGRASTVPAPGWARPNAAGAAAATLAVGAGRRSGG